MTAPDDADLAAQLRRLATVLHSGMVDDNARRAALHRLTEVEELLTGGEPRLRWYEARPDASLRACNRDLSPWSGALNAASPPMVLEVGQLPDGQPAMIGRVRLDRLREGPPNCAHGGVVAGLFDEAMGAAQRLSGRDGGVTARLTVRYRKLTPLATDLEIQAWISDERTRRLMIKAVCRAAGSGITAEAEAIFLRAKP